MVLQLVFTGVVACYVIGIHRQIKNLIVHGMSWRAGDGEIQHARQETSSAALDRLKKHPSDMVRAAAAGNRNVSEETLWCFVRDNSALVRLYAAGNENLTGGMRSVLADDKDPHVRNHVAICEKRHAGSSQ